MFSAALYHATYFVPCSSLKQNRILCSFFYIFYVFRGQSFGFGDCAINPNPTAEQLAEIAFPLPILAFGIEPKSPCFRIHLVRQEKEMK
jgi:phosphotransacetylase